MITEKAIKKEITYGNTVISFDIIFRKRKTLGIEVHPDTSVKVIAPLEASLDKIKERVSKKASWILKTQNFFKPFQPLPGKKEYVSGETFYYLGRQYRLKVLKGDVQEIKLKGKFIWIYIFDKNDLEGIKKLIDGWYRIHAQKKFSERMEIILAGFKKYKINAPKLLIKKMSKRWGSYIDGKVILNTKLIEAPVHCIDYVITHELCHIKYPNHGRGFYQFLEKLMPDWKERKERLEKIC